jgi:ammonia channel protein AmtB
MLYSLKTYYSTDAYEHICYNRYTVLLSLRELFIERTLKSGWFHLSSQESQAISICFVLDWSFVVTLILTMFPLDDLMMSRLDALDLKFELNILKQHNTS